MVQRLAALGHLGMRGRRLAALIAVHGKRGASRALGVSSDDIEGFVRVAAAANAVEPAEAPHRRDYVPVRRLKPAEVRGLAELVSALVAAMGLRALAKRAGCAPRTIVLYARGSMTRTAPMLSALAPLMGQRDATDLLSLAAATGYLPVPPGGRRAKPPNAGLHEVDVKPQGAAGAIVWACARAGATAMEMAAYAEVPVDDLHAAMSGAGLPQGVVDALGRMLVRLTEGWE